MLPDDVVCFLQRRLRWRGDELFQRRHERADLLAAVHAGDAVIAARNDAEQAAVRRAVIRDGDGRIAVLRLERQNVRQCAVRRQVGRRDDKARLVVLDAGDHRRLGFNGLRAINKDSPPSFASAMASLSSETDCMIADTMGIFREMAGSSPLRKRVSGVRSETLAGTQSSAV